MAVKQDTHTHEGIVLHHILFYTALIQSSIYLRTKCCSNLVTAMVFFLRARSFPSAGAGSNCLHLFRSMGTRLSASGTEAQDSQVAKKTRHTNYKFVDKVQVEVIGGRGGNGCVSFEGTLTSFDGALMCDKLPMLCSAVTWSKKTKWWQWRIRRKCLCCCGQGSEGCRTMAQLSITLLIRPIQEMTSFTMQTFHFNGGPGVHGGSDGLKGRRGTSA